MGVTIRWIAYFGFFLAFLIALLIKNHPKNYEKNNNNANNRKSVSKNLKIVLLNKQSWYIGIYSFLIWTQILGFASLWGAPFLCLSSKLDNLRATYAISYIWIGVGIASPIIGWLSDFINQRCILMSICAMLGTAVMTVIVFVSDIPVITLNILMFTLGIASSGQTISFALIKDINTQQTNSTANGFNNMCIVSGGLIFPILIGKILDIKWNGVILNNIHMYDLFSYQVALSTLPACYLLASIISIFCIKETYCKTSLQNYQ